MSAAAFALLAAVAACAVGIALVLVLPERLVPRVTAAAGAVASFPLAWAGALGLFSGGATTWTLWTVPAIGPITLSLDRLTGTFLLVTALVALPASVFVAEALPSLGCSYRLRPFGVWFLGLIVAVIGVLTASDVFTFLVAWELMSLLCFLLVGYQHLDTDRGHAAYLMLAYGEAGAVAVAVGLLLMAGHASALDLRAVGAAAAQLGPGTRWAVFLLTFFGFGVKAGLVPVNSWLPRAYAAAPSAFAPLLAGATLDLGLYGILRFDAALLRPWSAAPGLILLVVGAITAFVGILYATIETDLKTLLAHSSTENAGIATAGIGAGLVFLQAQHPMIAGIAFITVLYHIANHSLFKTLLFLGAGTVEERTGTADLDRLGGLVRRLPWVAAGFLVGTLAVAGLPPLNGFVSEWLTLQTMLASAALASVPVKVAFALSGALLALTSALTVTCFVKAFGMAFLGVSRSKAAEEPAPTGWTARVPVALLAISCVLLGVLPTWVIPALDRAATDLAGASARNALVPPFFTGATGHETLPAGFVADFHAIGAQVGQSVLPGPGLVLMHRGGAANPVVYAASPFWMLVVLAGLVGAAWLFRRMLRARRREPVSVRAPWAGGVRVLLPEMTYTATGFSNPVRVVFDAVFRPSTVEDTRETVAQHFRTAIRRERNEVHVIERVAVAPTRRAALRLAGWLARMHHGRLNTYVAYILLAVLAGLLLTAWR